MTKTRKELIDAIAFDRACFEAECERKNGKPVAFDTSAVFSALKLRVGVEDANKICSTRFVNETIKKAESFRRMYSNEDLLD